MRAPTVSVVVPNLDSPWIDRTLAALAAQGAPGEDVEILVVGRDAPGLVPRDVPGLTFLESADRLNPAAARNRGVAAARGELILFTDADCKPQTRWIQHLTATLAKAPIAGGAVTFPTAPDETGVWALADNIASFHDLFADRPAEADTRGPIGSLNLGMRREAWDAVGPFDETLPTSEDHDWILRARARGLATAWVPEALVEHAAVRKNRAELEGHATWYGIHFHRFRTLHPGAFATGPTWKSRHLLALAAPLKSVTGARAIFRQHPLLAGCRRALPGVIAFRRAWYRAVLAGWAAGEVAGKA